jgi:hypothetical protein
MSKSPAGVLEEIPSQDGPIVIRGSNTGIAGITAEINGRILNIVDFFNQSLEAIYVDAYKGVLDKYEHELQTTNLAGYNCPKLIRAPLCIDRAGYEPETYPDDRTLLKALFSEYNAAVKDAANRIAQWGLLVEQWYAGINRGPKA